MVYSKPVEYVSEFPVAVSGLVEIHEIHVYFGIRQPFVELRMQMQKRFQQYLKRVYPHFGG